LNENNALLIGQQTTSFLMFMIMYKTKMVEAKNTTTMAATNERTVITA
jgi:hypothetical protein